MSEHYNLDDIVHMGLLTGLQMAEECQECKINTHHLHGTPLCIIFYVVHNTTYTLLFYTVVSICYVHLKYKNIFPNNHININSLKEIVDNVIKPATGTISHI